MSIWTNRFSSWLHPEGQLTFSLSNCSQSSRNQFRFPCGLYFPARCCIFLQGSVSSPSAFPNVNVLKFREIQINATI